MSLIDGLMVVASLAAGLWWAFSRRRRPAALEALSLGALLLAAITLAVDGVQWQPGRMSGPAREGDPRV